MIFQDITLTGGYQILLTIPPTFTIEYLLVGAGGGGSYGHDTFYGGSGGGAGGAFSGSSVVSSGYAITVGTGGTGGTVSTAATNGGDTVLISAFAETYTALGGGFGAQANGSPEINYGGNGGSGGGGSYFNGNNPAANGIGLQPSSATGGYGNDSGTGYVGNGYGASGGGAGTAGYAYNDAVNPGQGGSGYLFSSFSIYGTDASNSTAPSSGKGYFAGGGAAGNWSNRGARAGGVGGGGGSIDGPGASGLANTGGGGAGGGGDNYNGGDGGSGIVIMRYSSAYPAAGATSGSPTVTVTGGYRYYMWANSGTINF